MLDIVKNEIAHSIPEAISLLNQNHGALVVAGGTDILVKIRAGKINKAHLVYINKISELKGISINESGVIKIGPLTTFRELENNPLILEFLPILAIAAGSVGGPQIRAAGTIGGNICNGVTSADTSSSLLTLNARLEISNNNTTHDTLIKDFYLGPSRVALPNGSLLTAIHIDKKDYTGYKGHYEKYSQRNAMDIATLGCAVQLKLNKEKTLIDDIRIAFGVAAPVPLRLSKAEDSLKGMTIDQALLKGPSIVRSEISPRDSWRASKDFRLHIAGEIFNKALKLAWKASFA